MTNFTNNDLDLFQLTLEDFASVPLLTAEQEYALGLRILEGDMEARNELVEHNCLWAAKLALKAAKKTSVSKEDLVSVACQALFRAAEKFDCTRGVRFATFCKFDCEAAISKFIKENSTPHSISEHDLEAISALKRLAYEFYGENGEDPSSEELAILYNKNHKRQLSVEDVGFLMGSLNHGSLDDKVGMDSDGKKLTVKDVVAADVDTPAISAEKSEERRICLEAIYSLEPRKAEILDFCLGFSTGVRHNFREAGERFDLSAERARQLWKSGCADLLDGPYASVLRAYYEDSDRCA